MGAPFPSASRELPRAGIERAGAIRTRSHPEFIVSKYKLKQAEGISLVRQKRESGTQRLAFSSRPFVLCGLPVRRPPADQLVYQRRNGHFVLQLTGHPDFGLPYGQDRLVPIFLATLAVQQKSQFVRFRSAAEMLDTFGLAKGGKEYRRLVAAFERIFGAAIFFGTDQTRGAAQIVHRSRFNFLREAQIWCYRNPDEAPLSGDFANMVVLSDEFYQEITDSHGPGGRKGVRVRTNSARPRHVADLTALHREIGGEDSALRRVRPRCTTRMRRVHAATEIQGHARTMDYHDSGSVAAMPRGYLP